VAVMMPVAGDPTPCANAPAPGFVLIQNLRAHAQPRTIGLLAAQAA